MTLNIKYKLKDNWKKVKNIHLIQWCARSALTLALEEIFTLDENRNARAPYFDDARAPSVTERLIILWDVI